MTDGRSKICRETGSQDHWRFEDESGVLLAHCDYSHSQGQINQRRDSIVGFCVAEDREGWRCLTAVFPSGYPDDTDDVAAIGIEEFLDTIGRFSSSVRNLRMGAAFQNIYSEDVNASAIPVRDPNFNIFKVAFGVARNGGRHRFAEQEACLRSLLPQLLEKNCERDGSGACGCVAGCGSDPLPQTVLIFTTAPSRVRNEREVRHCEQGEGAKERAPAHHQQSAFEIPHSRPITTRCLGPARAA